MKPWDVAIRRFDIPLVQALRIQDHELLSRQGAYLVVKDELGHEGLGECAPLPGLSVASFDQALGQLQGLAAKLAQGPCPEPDTVEAHTDLFPSVRMALDMAVQDLAWQRSGCFEKGARMSLLLNGLVMGQDKGLDDSVNTLLNQGYTSVKIKVARQPLAQDKENVKRVRDLVAGRAGVRLDANRSWSLEQACDFALAVGPESIEYIEEPTQTVRDHLAFWQKTGMRVALDESLQGGHVPLGVASEALGAFILKPAIVGGLDRVGHLIDRARALGIPAVLSSVFESPVALGFYAKLAMTYGLDRHAHGLDTWRWLQLNAQDLPFMIEQGNLVLHV